MPLLPWKSACCARAVLWVTLAATPIPLSPGAWAGDGEKLALGREVFLERAEPQCAICHTLADAGAAGAVGPNLDDLKPNEEQVRTAVKGGVGAMPPFEDVLSAEEIDAVSHYVATAAGGG